MEYPSLPAIHTVSTCLSRNVSQTYNSELSSVDCPSLPAIQTVETCLSRNVSQNYYSELSAVEYPSLPAIQAVVTCLSRNVSENYNSELSAVEYPSLPAIQTVSTCLSRNVSQTYNSELSGVEYRLCQLFKLHRPVCPGMCLRTITLSCPVWNTRLHQLFTLLSTCLSRNVSQNYNCLAVRRGMPIPASYSNCFDMSVPEYV